MASDIATSFTSSAAYKSTVAPPAFCLASSAGWQVSCFIDGFCSNAHFELRRLCQQYRSDLRWLGSHNCTGQMVRQRATESLPEVVVEVQLFDHAQSKLRWLLESREVVQQSDPRNPKPMYTSHVNEIRKALERALRAWATATEGASEPVFNEETRCFQLTLSDLVTVVLRIVYPSVDPAVVLWEAQSCLLEPIPDAWLAERLAAPDLA